MTIDNLVGVPLAEDPRVKIDGTIEFEEFNDLHGGCEVDDEYLGGERAYEDIVGTATHPKPEHGVRSHCWTHDVSSAVKIKVGF